MSKKILFKSNIFPVCDKLMKKGIRPTIHSVRTASGINTGSNSTLQALIAQWYQEKDPADIASVHVNSLSKELPEELVRATEYLYTSILAESNKRLDQAIETVKQDKEWVLSELQKLAETREEMEAQRQAAQDLNAQLREELAISKNELQQAHFVINSIKDEKEELYRQRERLKCEIKQQSIATDAEIQRLTDQVAVANSFLRMTEEGKKAELELLTLQADNLTQKLNKLISQMGDLSNNKNIRKTQHWQEHIQDILKGYSD